MDCHGAKHSQNGAAKLQSRKADKRVEQNGGAAGIDGMEIAAFRDFLAEHWDTILGKLRDGSYCPSPVRRVELIRFAHPSGSHSAVCLPSVGSRNRMARKGRWAYQQCWIVSFNKRSLKS